MGHMGGLGEGVKRAVAALGLAALDPSGATAAIPKEPERPALSRQRSDTDPMLRIHAQEALEEEQKADRMFGNEEIAAGVVKKYFEDVEAHQNHQKRLHEYQNSNLNLWQRLQSGDFGDESVTDFDRRRTAQNLLEQTVKELRSITSPLEKPVGDESRIKRYGTVTILRMNNINLKFKTFNEYVQNEEDLIDKAYSGWLLRPRPINQ